MEEKKEQKLSYEQLNDVANQLSSQLQQARHQITQMSSVLNKLPYLFKVVEIGVNDFFDKEFVDKCATELKSIMQPEEITEDEKA